MTDRETATSVVHRTRLDPAQCLGLAVLVLAAAAGVALVLIATGLFIQMVQ